MTLYSHANLAYDKVFFGDPATSYVCQCWSTPTEAVADYRRTVHYLPDHPCFSPGNPGYQVLATNIDLDSFNPTNYPEFFL